jgi:hypothetical protein
MINGEVRRSARAWNGDGALAKFAVAVGGGAGAVERLRGGTSLIGGAGWRLYMTS